MRKRDHQTKAARTPQEEAAADREIQSLIEQELAEAAVQYRLKRPPEQRGRPTKCEIN